MSNRLSDLLIHSVFLSRGTFNPLLTIHYTPFLCIFWYISCSMYIHLRNHFLIIPPRHYFLVSLNIVIHTQITLSQTKSVQISYKFSYGFRTDSIRNTHHFSPATPAWLRTTLHEHSRHRNRSKRPSKRAGRGCDSQLALPYTCERES